MKITLSKSQWEKIGKDNNWLTKTANLPWAKNPDVAKLAQSINFLYSKLMPNLQQQVGALAGDLIRALDNAFAQQAQFEGNPAAQQKPV